RRRRTPAPGRSRSPRSRGAGGRCRSYEPLRRRSASGDLEAELSVADPDHVTRGQLRLPVQFAGVEQGAVRGVEVLDEVAAAAIEDPGMEARRVAIVEPDVGVGGTPQRPPAEEIEVIALVEPPALLDDQERVGGLPLTTEDVVVARLVTRRGGAAQVTQRASRHPDQEEEEHGEKAELERYRQRLERGVHCSMSNAKTLVPSAISSPPASPP